MIHLYLILFVFDLLFMFDSFIVFIFDLFITSYPMFAFFCKTRAWTNTNKTATKETSNDLTDQTEQKKNWMKSPISSSSSSSFSSMDGSRTTIHPCHPHHVHVIQKKTRCIGIKMKSNINSKWNINKSKINKSNIYK